MIWSGEPLAFTDKAIWTWVGSLSNSQISSLSPSSLGRTIREEEGTWKEGNQLPDLPLCCSKHYTKVSENGIFWAISACASFSFLPWLLLCSALLCFKDHPFSSKKRGGFFLVKSHQMLTTKKHTCEAVQKRWDGFCSTLPLEDHSTSPTLGSFVFAEKVGIFSPHVSEHRHHTDSDSDQQVALPLDQRMQILHSQGHVILQK